MHRVLTRPSLAAALAACVLLVGCVSAAPPAPRYPEITFSGPPIRLSVGAIDVVQQYASPRAQPNVEYLFPVTPESMAARWPKDRLVVVGGSPLRARYIVKDASVMVTDLPRTEGIRGAFTKDQAQRYDAVLDVELDIIDERNFPLATVTAHAERRQSIAEDFTPVQRDETWYGMTQALAKDLDAELDKNVHASLGKYIAY